MNIHSIFGAISPIFRRKRAQLMGALLPLAPTQRVLDVGGSTGFWRQAGRPSAAITLLNLSANVAGIGEEPGFEFISGDGCALPFADGAFDVVFSNSVIEHVGTWERQQAFAREARRVGRRRLWVQTPAREFFIEPHLLAPFVHWLPRRTQRGLIRWATGWGWLTRPTPREVETFLAEVRLLTRREMQELFPDCEILTERFCGLAKSYIAVRRR